MNRSSLLATFPSEDVEWSLLTLLTLCAAVCTDEELSFSSLEDGSELGDKVATSLTAMKQAGGEEVLR